MSNAIKNLREYIDNDEIYQKYKKGIEPSHNDGSGDFEWFCINHCKDIEELIEESKKNFVQRTNADLFLTCVGFDLKYMNEVIKNMPPSKDTKELLKSLKDIEKNICKIQQSELTSSQE